MKIMARRSFRDAEKILTKFILAKKNRSRNKAE